MHEEAADELVCIKPHDLHSVSAFDPVVLPSERYGIDVGADEALVRDRDTVRVSAEIGQYRFGAAEWRFGIDHPFGFAQRSQPSGKGISVHQPSQITKEGKLSGAMKRHQSLHKQAAKQS